MLRSRIPVSRLSALVLSAALLAACGGGEAPAELLAKAREAYAKSDYNSAAIHIRNALQQTPGDGEARLLFGQVLLEQADPTGAESELRKARESGIAAARSVPLIAQAMLLGGKAERALAEFETTRLDEPRAQAALLSTLGEAELALQKSDKARALYDAALASQPDFAPALVGKARVLALFDKDSAGAQALLARALAQDANLPEAMLLQADLLEGEGQHEQAVAVLRAVVQADPRLLSARHRLAARLIEAGRLDEAQTELATAEKLAPTQPQTRYFKALLALRRDQNVEARDILLGLLKQSPTHVPTQVLAATALVRLRDHAQAQSLLTRAVAAQPDLDYARKLLAESYLINGEPGRALETLQPLQGARSDAQARSLAAEAHLALGDYSRAADLWLTVAQSEPENPDARLRLGIARLRKGEELAALQELERASQNARTSLQADIQRVTIYLRQKDIARAQSVSQALLQRQPDNSVAHGLRGEVLLAAGDEALARKSFERALELTPVYLPAAVTLARMDLLARRPDAARERFEAVIAREPKNARAYLALAQFLIDTQAPLAQARAVLERAVSADPTQGEPRVSLTQFLMTADEPAQALNVAQQAVAAFPDDPAMVRLLGRVQLTVGERQQAIASFAKLASLEPQSPDALLELAGAQIAANERTDAHRSLRKALELRPDHVDVQQRLVGLLMADQRFEEALAIAREVSRQRPDEVVGTVMEADIEAQRKDWPRTIAVLEARLQRKRDDMVLTRRLYSAYKAAGRPADAERLVADWFRADPKDTSMRVYLGEVALRAGDYAAAVTHYKRLLELAPNSAATLNNLAWAAEQLKDPKALEYAERAVRIAPGKPELMETLGSMLVARGQNARGLQLLRDAAARAPRNYEVRLSYARALLNTGQRDGARAELDQILSRAPAEHPVRAQAQSLRAGL